MADELISALNDEEMASVQVKLWQLLAHRTALYTMGESSSVRTETAKELFESVCFTLDMALRSEGLPREAMVQADLNALFDKGIKEIERQIKTVISLWSKVYLTLPPIRNRYLSATLKSISEFKGKYHYMYFAHEIPCEIDYLLCVPVAESCKGTDYLTKYLRRLCAENAVFSRFPMQSAEKLIAAVNGDYKSLPLNMCEPLLVNALGLCLLGRQPTDLNITQTDREKLQKILSFGSTEKQISSAAALLCRAIGLNDAFTRRYVADTAKLHLPQIKTALQAGDLQGVFVTF